MRDWLVDWGARLIRATGTVDRAYRLFNRARRELVLALASDALLDRYNDRAYSADDAYRTGSSSFRRHLFAWEEQAIARFFPPPPARLLIGGAGGGREVFALAEKGYDVVAFERSPVPVEAMAAQVPEGLSVQVYRAGYEDLPLLAPARPGEPSASLEEMPPFDAGIVGWGSFTHLRTEEQRVKTLLAFARATQGPVLVSFLARPDDTGPPAKPGRLRRLLRGRYNQDPGNVFDIGYGLFHRYSQTEITALARQARLALVHLSLDADETTWPYAVFAAGSS